MKKVLMIITTSFNVSGGLSSVALNYYKYLPDDDCSIDFLSTNKITDELNEYLKSKGSRYFQLPNRKQHILKYILKLNKIIKDGDYDIVHIHGNSATMLFELIPATLQKVTSRIVHCHSAASDYLLLHKVCYPFFRRMYDIGIAVSKKSGEWLYGRTSYIILNNAIDLSHYEFSQTIREQVRNKYSLGSKYVIGTAGKLVKAKNQEFLISIFYKYHLVNKESVLLIVGDGVLRSSLEQRVKDLHLENSVIFVGMVDDVNPYYQAMDYFLFTSISEGLGMVLIEAQATGLHCLASNKIPLETNVTDNIKYESLDKGDEYWSQMIPKKINEKRYEESIRNKSLIKQYGYDIEDQAKRLLEIYNLKSNM